MAPRGAAEAKPMEDVDQRRVRRHPVHRPLAYRLTHIASTLCCVCRPLCLRFLGPEFLWVRSQDSNTLIYHCTEFFSRAPCGQPPIPQVPKRRHAHGSYYLLQTAVGFGGKRPTLRPPGRREPHPSARDPPFQVSYCSPPASRFSPSSPRAPPALVAGRAFVSHERDGSARPTSARPKVARLTRCRRRTGRGPTVREMLSHSREIAGATSTSLGARSVSPSAGG